MKQLDLTKHQQKSKVDLTTLDPSDPLNNQMAPNLKHHPDYRRGWNQVKHGQRKQR